MYSQLKAEFEYDLEDLRKWKRELKTFALVRDVEGNLWDVRDARATKHGFDLLFGKPASRLAPDNGGPNRLIATKELCDFWEANRLNRATGVILDLPAGRTTLKRVRRRLGFNCLDDLCEFWTERMDDLATLKPREFAALHDVSVPVVVHSRRKRIGKSTRESRWWLEPATLAILQSGITFREKAEKLGIGTSHAHRLTIRARELRDARTLPCSFPESLAA
jgi:hypothetical protein